MTDEAEVPPASKEDYEMERFVNKFTGTLPILYTAIPIPISKGIIEGQPFFFTRRSPGVDISLEEGDEAVKKTIHDSLKSLFNAMAEMVHEQSRKGCVMYDYSPPSLNLPDSGVQQITDGIFLAVAEEGYDHYYELCCYMIKPPYVEIEMQVGLQYFDGGSWHQAGDFPFEGMAWDSLGGDDANYRTIDLQTGETMTDKKLPLPGLDDQVVAGPIDADE